MNRLGPRRLASCARPGARMVDYMKRLGRQRRNSSLGGAALVVLAMTLSACVSPLGPADYIPAMSGNGEGRHDECAPFERDRSGARELDRQRR